jgi:hypothetical protein
MRHDQGGHVFHIFSYEMLENQSFWIKIKGLGGLPELTADLE